MNGNDFVKFFLRTPFCMILGNTMLITVTGRKSGREYSTPVGYYRENGQLWVLSNRDRTWWRNVRGGADVKLLLKGRTVSAHADTTMDEKDVENLLIKYVRNIPMAARSLGIRVESGIPNSEDVVRVAKERLFVRLNING